MQRVAELSYMKVNSSVIDRLHIRRRNQSPISDLILFGQRLNIATQHSLLAGIDIHVPFAGATVELFIHSREEALAGIWSHPESAVADHALNVHSRQQELPAN